MTISPETLSQIIAYSLLVIIVFILLKSRYYFDNMEIEVARFNYYSSIRRTWGEAMADLFKKKVQKRLEKHPEEFSDFLRRIDPDFIEAFELPAIFNAITNSPFALSSLSTSYEVARAKNMELCQLFKPFVPMVMRKYAYEDLFSTGTAGCEFFWIELGISALQEVLSSIGSIKELEKLTRTAHEYFHPLIDEREMEILENDREFTPEHFFEIFKILSIDSPAWEYWVKSFSEFLILLNISLFDIAGALRLTSNFTGNIKFKEPILHILKRFVPEFSEASIEEWLPRFSNEPEYVAIFAERMKNLYAEADIDVLRKKWRQYYYNNNSERRILELFDQLLLASAEKLPRDSFLPIWPHLPRQSKAWHHVAECLCDIEAIKHGIASQE